MSQYVINPSKMCFWFTLVSLLSMVPEGDSKNTRVAQNKRWKKKVVTCICSLFLLYLTLKIASTLSNP